MKKLTETEINLVNSDLEPFEKYLQSVGMINEYFKKKYNGISIYTESKEVLKGANADTKLENGEGSKRYIRLGENIIGDDKKRARALYHEIGHAILGLTDSSKETVESVLSSIVNTRRNHSNELSSDAKIYLEGLKLLEEYLVEKFSIAMMQKVKGIPEPKKERCQHPGISGNYIYMASFDTNYGIFESLCDKLVGKTFGNLSNTLNAGISEKYFTEFFNKYDNVELMKILGNLGQVKRAIYSYAGQNNAQYNSNDIAQILRDTNSMIEAIQVNQEYSINPTTINALTTDTMNKKTGKLSIALENAKNFFSKIFLKDQTDIHR